MVRRRARTRGVATRSRDPQAPRTSQRGRLVSLGSYVRAGSALDELAVLHVGRVPCAVLPFGIVADSESPAPATVAASWQLCFKSGTVRVFSR